MAKTLGDKISGVTGIVGNIIGGVNAAKQLFTNQNKINEKNDKRQIDQQGKLNIINEASAKRLADYEQQLKLQMWKDTNYSAQLEQAGMAGLSKVAVLGGSGGGAGGASVSSSGIGNGAANASATQMANTQTELAKAQANNLNANTEKVKVETDKIGGETTGVKLDNQMKELNNKIKGMTWNEQVNTIVADAQTAISESIVAGKDADIKGKTWETEIENIKANYAQTLIENAATKQGITLDKERVKQIANDIMMRSIENETTKRGQDVSKENMEELTEAMLWSAGINATGNLVKGLIDIKRMKKGSTSTTTHGNGKVSTTIHKQN